MKMYPDGGGVYIHEIYFGDGQKNCCERWFFLETNF